MKYSFRLNEVGDEKLLSMKHYLVEKSLVKEDTITEVVKLALVVLERDINKEKKKKEEDYQKFLNSKQS